jgi:uncharacterized protein (DUF1697 family)
MTTQIALLKGINVGRNKRLAMADLRSLLDAQGYREVRTILQSGNAVFDAGATAPATIESRLRAALLREHAIDVACLVVSADRLRRVVEENPLAEHASDGSRLVVHFLSAQPAPALLAAHDPTRLDPDRARLGEQVIYQWCEDGVLASPQLAAFAERQFGVSVTARNWNTVLKLVAALDKR